MQLLVPVPSGWDPILGIEIQKQRLVTLLSQPGRDPLSPSVALAAVADEDRAHKADAVIDLAEYSPS